MSETTISQEKVREEHLAEINQAAHWAYLAAVMAGGTLLMLALIALLGGSA